MCTARMHHPKWGRHHHKHHAKRFWKNKFAMWNYPPINVEELDDKYEIKLYAAGYTKGDFEIDLQDNTLIVAVKKEEDTVTERHWSRYEFKPGSFERRFELNDKIDKEAITAKYQNGVLTVTLQKVTGAETVRQNIEVK